MLPGFPKKNESNTLLPGFPKRSLSNALFPGLGKMSKISAEVAGDIVYLTGWDQNNIYEITISPTEIDSNLTHFSLLIILDSNQSDMFTEVGSFFEKVAVAKADGTQLYVEVEQWDSGSQIALLHVSKDDFIISASQDTKLYLYYDSTHGDNTDYVGEAGDSVVQNIYTANHKVVFNLAEDPSGGSNCIKDSTSNSNHGTPQGAMLTEDLIDGSIGKAIETDGVDDRIEISDTDDFYIGTGNASLVITFRRSRIATREFLCGSMNSGGATTATNFVIELQATNMIRIFQGYNTSQGFIFLPELSIADTNLHQIALVRNGTKYSIYLDNVVGGTTRTVTGYDFTNQSEDFIIGRAGEFASYHCQAKIEQFIFIKGHALSSAERKAYYEARLNNLLTITKKE